MNAKPAAFLLRSFLLLLASTAVASEPVGIVGVSIHPRSPTLPLGLPLVLDIEFANLSDNPVPVVRGEPLLDRLVLGVAYRPSSEARAFCSSLGSSVRHPTPAILSELLKANDPIQPVARAQGDASPDQIHSLCQVLDRPVAFQSLTGIDCGASRPEPLAPGHTRRVRVAVEPERWRGTTVFDLPGDYLLSAGYDSRSPPYPQIRPGVAAVRFVHLPSDQSRRLARARQLLAVAQDATETEEALHHLRRVIESAPYSEHAAFARYNLGVRHLRLLMTKSKKLDMVQRLKLLIGTGVVDLCAAPLDQFPGPEFARPCRALVGFEAVMNLDLERVGATLQEVLDAAPEGYEAAPGMNLDVRRFVDGMRECFVQVDGGAPQAGSGSKLVPTDECRRQMEEFQAS